MIFVLGVLIGVLAGSLVTYFLLAFRLESALNEEKARSRSERVIDKVNAYQIEDTNVRIQNMESHLEEELLDRTEGVKHRALQREEEDEAREERKLDKQERKEDRQERKEDREERRRAYE